MALSVLIFQVAAKGHTSHATRHTSLVTRHTSHVTQGKACDSNVVEMKATGGGSILAAVQQLKALKAPALAAHRLQVLAQDAARAELQLGGVGEGGTGLIGEGGTGLIYVRVQVEELDAVLNPRMRCCAIC